MGKLIYLAITSLDGYVVDDHGNFEWSAPDEQVHRFINDLVRPVGTHLYGRRMYEVMKVWDDAEMTAGQPSVIVDFADMWRSATKIVFSATLDNVSTSRTRLAPPLHLDTLRQMKSDIEGDISISGPTLAADALRAGLVDDVYLFLGPILVGGGTSAFPRELGHHVALELVDQRRFDNGVVYTHHRALSNETTPAEADITPNENGPESGPGTTTD